MSQQEVELQQCRRERDQAALRAKALENQLQDVEGEAETKTAAKDDRVRQVKLMEVNGDARRAIQISDSRPPSGWLKRRRSLYAGQDRPAGAEPGRGASERRPADGPDRPGTRAGTAASPRS